MKATLFYFALLLFVFQSNVNGTPAQIMIVRHAERLVDGERLSLKGKERAATFVPFFMETKELLAFGPPVAVYAMGSSKEDSSKRAFDTVQALASSLKLTVENAYAKDEYRQMVDEIKREPSYVGRTVLICWDHQGIPEIARAFGALQTPARWPIEQYDRIWLITYSPTGRANFINYPQRLMFGDTTN